MSGRRTRHRGRGELLVAGVVLALLALGYSGALTWFAPAQPFLAALALVLSVIAVLSRLRGQVACPLPTAEPARSAATL